MKLINSPEAEALRHFLKENQPKTRLGHIETYKDVASRARNILGVKVIYDFNLEACLTPGEIRARSNKKDYQVNNDPRIHAMIQAMRLEADKVAELMNLMLAFQTRVMEEMDRKKVNKHTK